LVCSCFVITIYCQWVSGLHLHVSKMIDNVHFLNVCACLIRSLSMIVQCVWIDWSGLEQSWVSDSHQSLAINSLIMSLIKHKSLKTFCLCYHDPAFGNDRPSPWPVNHRSTLTCCDLFRWREQVFFQNVPTIVTKVICDTVVFYLYVKRDLSML